MAAQAKTSVAGDYILQAPFLVKRVSLTQTEASTDTCVITHGGPGTPDIVIPICTGALVADSSPTVVARAATTTTIDFQAAPTTADVILVWFKHVAP